MPWWIVSVSSGKEAPACAALARKGYPDAWYPKRKIDTRPRSKTARVKAARQRAGMPAPPPRYIERAWVPGYVFVDAPAIECHRINGMHGRLHMRVLSPGGEPYRLEDADMARMRDVPKRVREMVHAVAAAERAARAQVEPREGEPAKIVEGPFSGVSGPVTAMRGDEVRIEGAGSLPVWVPKEYAERVA